MDNAANRTASARWRNKKFGQGYRALTVYLSPEALQKIKLLHRHFGTKRKAALLIEKAIETLYQKTRQKLT